MKKFQVFLAILQSVMREFSLFVKKIATKIADTHSFVQIIAASVSLAIIFLVFISVVMEPPVRRSIFFFPDTKSGKIRQEIRYLPNVRGIDARLDLYSGELVLGPINPEFKPLFNENVTVVRSFVKNGAAYIDLSGEALVPDEGVASSVEACSLFKKNVFTNFRTLDKIYLYINGIEVYSETPGVDAEKNKKR